MTGTLTARLARLRAVFGERWRIETTEPGPGTPRFFIAAERSTGRKIVTTSLAELAQRLTRPGRPPRE
jgi:hypothetical protein